MADRRAHIPGIFRVLLTLALCAGPAAPARSESDAVSEHALKAVLFYKLPQFAYLPTGAQGRDPVLCGLGSHPIMEALEKLGRTPGLTYRTLTLSGISAGTRCDFLFIARGEGSHLETILQRLKGSDSVTVSDIPGFARAGGMVELASNPDKQGVQILINRKAAQKRGIEFNAQLLRLARIVEP